MHHDPLLSSARKPFCSFGHVWVVLALWVPVPMGEQRGFAQPLLFRLDVGANRGVTRHARGRPRRGTRGQAAERADTALGHGHWTSTMLLKRWMAKVLAESRRIAHEHAKYRPVAADLTGFWRSQLHGCQTSHDDCRARVASSAIALCGFS
jgi:hypothetical protein